MAENNPERSLVENLGPDIKTRMLQNPPNESVQFTQYESTNNSQVVLPVNKSGSRSGVGMSKKELMKYVNDPFWIRLRTFLFILFWVVWVAMLVCSVLIIALASGCPATASLPWWKKSSLVQVSVQTEGATLKEKLSQATAEVNKLKDSLDTLKSAGLDGLLVTGLDVFLLANLDNQTQAETDQLRDALSNLVMAIHDDEVKGKIIIALKLSETSVKHLWFNESKDSPANATTHAYYIWDTTNDHGNVSSLKWFYETDKFKNETESDMYYGSKSLNGSTAVLNYANAAMKEEMESLVLSWVRTKVNGIQADGDFWVKDSEGRTYASKEATLQVHKWIKKGGQNKALLVVNSQIAEELVKQGEDAATFELAPESGLWTNLSKAIDLQEELKKVFLHYVQLDNDEPVNSTAINDNTPIDVGAGWRSFQVEYPANENNTIAINYGLPIAEGVLVAFYLLPKSSPIIQTNGPATQQLAHVKSNKFLATLTKLRRDQSESFQLGTTQLPEVVNSNEVFAVSRVYKEMNTYLLLINFANTSKEVEIKGKFPDESLFTSRVVLSDTQNMGAIGHEVDLKKVNLLPKQVLLVELAPKE